MKQEDIQAIIKSFVIGEISIKDFMKQYNENNEISNWLQYVLDEMIRNDLPVKKRTYVDERGKSYTPKSTVEELIPKLAISDSMLHPSWRQPPTVAEYIGYFNAGSISGAYSIYLLISDIYYQVDDEAEQVDFYENEYGFMLNTVPQYLEGGDSEEYICNYILPDFPPTMKKTERKTKARAAIRNAFKREIKGYPRWLQSSKWPIGENNLPMIYIKQKLDIDYAEYYFKDQTTGEIVVVKQSC